MRNSKKLLGFIGVAIAMFIGTLDSTIINIALPDIMKYFKESLNDTSWISTIYVLGLSVFMITASKLADQFGRKKLMVIGLLMFGTSSAMCALSRSLMFLIVMRFIQGIGGAIITPIVIPMAIEIFGKEKTKVAASGIGAVTALAAAGGPPIGGLLIKYVNWQSIFFINVPFAFISVILTILCINESYDDTVSKSIDWVGMFLLTSALFLLTFALLKGKDYGWNSKVIIFMFIGAFISSVFFIITELRVKAPLVELSLFRESTFTASSICYMITGFGLVSPLLIFNVFLQNALSYEALAAAFIIMAVSLTVIIAMPLGTYVADKLDARIVNFLGVLFMAVSIYLLSGLKVSTSKGTMIGYMILFGIGLGFSCQSLVSSIKYLPKEKSGIGSGIVNASRQIGTCIGIALLVSVLNTNIDNAKDKIRDNSVTSINNSKIEATVKKVMIKDIKENLKKGDSDNENSKSSEEKLENDIKNSLLSLNKVQGPKGNDTIAQLYNGTNTLYDSTGKILDGQNKLDSGINALTQGFGTLSSGSMTLNLGLQKVDNGLSKTLSGSQSLNTQGSQGLNTIFSAIEQLNNGAFKMTGQFSKSTDTGSPTIYDGVTKIADGSQNLSYNLNNYVSGVNNLIFAMIKNNSEAGLLLSGYENNLSQLQIQYSKATDMQTKEKLKKQIEALSNLIVLYSAGCDPSVTTEQQFEAKLIGLSDASKTPNLITNGGELTEGAAQLNGASQSIAMQFSDGGAFKNGMLQLSRGLNKLQQSKESINVLIAGINNVTSAVSQIKDASGRLVNGSQNLNNGINTAKSGSDTLMDGSEKLVDGDEKLNSGAEKLVNSIALAGQKGQIEDVMNNVKSDKDEKIAGAFDNVFLLSAIILMAASVCGLFTDRKTKKKAN